MHSPNSIDEKFMRLAIKEAKKGLGNTYPNPSVGAVIVKEKKVIARGYHKIFGGLHAEAIAINKAGKNARGATLYVTLEPCSYFGKTPPCTDAIIKSGIKKVVVAMRDPNPLNNGKGIKLLHQNHIKVKVGVLKKEAERLNIDFIKRMKKKRPFVTLKLAQSLDGKIATNSGDSKWISCSQSRNLVQYLRSKSDAIMVGINTILRDDPRLDIRDPKLLSQGSCRQPIKIIVDSILKTPLKARIFDKGTSAKIIIVTTQNRLRAKECMLRKRGAHIIKSGSASNMVDVRNMMKRLMRLGIANILVEGGGELAASLLKERLVDRLYLFIAPIIIGGRNAITSFEGKGTKNIRDAFRLKDIKVKKVGRDFLIEAEP